MEQALLSIREAAQFLGLSDRSIFWLLATGKLEKRKLGKRTLIPRVEVERLAASGVSGSIRRVSGEKRPEDSGVGRIGGSDSLPACSTAPIG